MQDPSLAWVRAKGGGQLARGLVHALALADDPPSMLRGRLGVSKRVAWAEPIDLEEVKAVGRACDCTVNDVLMAAAAGALREYMIERGDNVRSEEHTSELQSLMRTSYAVLCLKKKTTSKKK